MSLNHLLADFPFPEKVEAQLYIKINEVLLIISRPSPMVQLDTKIYRELRVPGFEPLADVFKIGHERLGCARFTPDVANLGGRCSDSAIAVDTLIVNRSRGRTQEKRLVDLESGYGLGESDQLSL